MADDDTVVIVCAELSLAQLGALRGNRAEDCSFCGRGVVLSTEGQRFRDEQLGAGEDVKLTCPRCAIERDGDAIVKGGVPGAVDRARREGYPLSDATVRAMHTTRLRDVFPDA